MEEIEIKQDLDQPQCRACLSVGRNLYPIGIYAEMYNKLAAEFNYVMNTDRDQYKVCWECRASLHRTMHFQHRVRTANEMFRLGQSYIYGTLSQLSTIVLNDCHPHTIYINDQTNIKTLGKIEDNVENAKSNSSSEYLDDENCDLDEKSEPDVLKAEPVLKEKPDVLKEEPNAKEEVSTLEQSKTIDNEEVVNKQRKPNRWARKRALQNKKPKFKLVAKKNLMDVFRKVQIDTFEVYKCIESERDSEYYKSRRHKCDSCVLAFDSKKLLLIHNKISHDKDIGRYSCDICSTRCRTKSSLATHILEHYYRYECVICHFVCYHQSQTNLHIAKEHRKVFQCLKCGLKFGGRREFFYHFKQWHERFECDQCGVTFKMRYCIKDHIRKQHSPFECVPCNKRFARYNGLWLHRATRHPARAPRPAYCVECDSRFADVHRYRWHLANSARHRKPRKPARIPCPGCDKVFSKNIYMKDHFALVHLKQYRYRCEPCDKNFIRNADLVRHRRRAHEGVAPPRDKVCYVCGRGFTTNKILTNHVRTHTGERPHACARCAASFAQRGALRAHVRALHRDQ